MINYLPKFNYLSIKLIRSRIRSGQELGQVIHQSPYKSTTHGLPQMDRKYPELWQFLSVYTASRTKAALRLCQNQPLYAITGLGVTVRNFDAANLQPFAGIFTLIRQRDS